MVVRVHVLALVHSRQGPIMGGTFGAVIRYHELWSIGLKNEAIGLSICLAIGMSFHGVILHHLACVS